MKQPLFKVLFGVLLAIVSVFAVAWSLLALPVFSQIRASVVSDLLSEQIGQTILVEGDIAADIGPVTRVFVKDAKIPSATITGVDLAVLSLLQLDVDIVELMQGQLNFDNLSVDGLSINLFTDESGTTSWSPGVVKAPTVEEQETGTVSPGIVDFLRNKRIEFSSISLEVDNRETGFVFKFDLEHFSQVLLDGNAGVSISSKGTVNEQPFAITGNYPNGQGSETSIEFGPVAVGFETTPNSGLAGEIFAGDLSVEIAEFGDLLDILLLDRSFEGNGTLTADVTATDQGFSIADLTSTITLPEGKQITADGQVDDLLSLSGLNLKVFGRLFPAGEEPPEAKKLEELQLTEVNAQIVSVEAGLEFKHLELKTNAIDQGFDRIGPISIGKVFRTESGALTLENVEIAIGPEQSPYITAQGEVANVLQLSGVQFSGGILIPASIALDEVVPSASEQFGQIHGNFQVDDANGGLSLREFTATSENTDLWVLKMRTKAENDSETQSIENKVELEIPDGAKLLTALGVDPVDRGPMSLAITNTGTPRDLATQILFTANQSDLRLQLDTQLSRPVPVVRGGLFSDHVDLVDLGNLIEAGVSAASLAGSDEQVKDEAAQTADANPGEANKDGRDHADADERQEADLVEFLDLEQVISVLDLLFQIDIAEISGPDGTSKIVSQITSKNGVAVFGPLEIAHAEGFLNLTASVDVPKNPGRVSVVGETGGWNVGNILDEIGLGIQAHGILGGKFDIESSTDSLDAFVDSMSGSATLSMSRGNIGTSLLELAGLGVLPWLFSKESQKGYTDVVCMVAPMSLKNGSASSNSIVLETKAVQLVVAGTINWRDDAIAIRAEPRPVGRPLARSAFPFEVTGRLSNPKFDLQVGAPNPLGIFAPKQKASDRTPCRPDKKQPAESKKQKKGGGLFGLKKK